MCICVCPYVHLLTQMRNVLPCWNRCQVWAKTSFSATGNMTDQLKRKQIKQIKITLHAVKWKLFSIKTTQRILYYKFWQSTKWISFSPFSESQKFMFKLKVLFEAIILAHRQHMYWGYNDFLHHYTLIIIWWDCCTSVTVSTITSKVFSSRAASLLWLQVLCTLADREYFIFMSCVCVCVCVCVCFACVGALSKKTQIPIT